MRRLETQTSNRSSSLPGASRCAFVRLGRAPSSWAGKPVSSEPQADSWEAAPALGCDTAFKDGDSAIFGLTPNYSIDAIHEPAAAPATFTFRDRTRGLGATQIADWRSSSLPLLQIVVVRAAIAIMAIAHNGLHGK